MGETCSRVSGREGVEGPVADHKLRAVILASQKVPAIEGVESERACKAPLAVSANERCAGESQAAPPSFASTAPCATTASYVSSVSSHTPQDSSIVVRSVPSAVAVAPDGPAAPLPLSPTVLVSPDGGASSIGDTISSPSLSTDPSTDGTGSSPTEAAGMPAAGGTAASVASSAAAAAGGAGSSEESLAAQLGRVYDKLKGDAGKLAYVTSADLLLLRSQAFASAEEFAAQLLEGGLTAGGAADRTALLNSAQLDRRLLQVVRVEKDMPGSPMAQGDGSPWTVVERRSRFDELRTLFEERRDLGGLTTVRYADGVEGCSAALLRKNPPADADDFAIKVLSGYYADGE